ncbi:MAG: hypothetical protein MZW92_30800 [Comamonadaceae bacterium]|nr:hypothetical protein [Comamonadaceae bacterium]
MKKLAMATCPVRRCRQRVGAGHAGGAVEDHRRRDQAGEVARASSPTNGGVLTGKIEKLARPEPSRTRSATSAPMRARTSRCWA